MHAAPFFVVLRWTLTFYLCNMITRYSNFKTKEFSCQLPDLEFAISMNRAKVSVKVSKSGEEREIFSELLFPDVESKIRLQDIDVLVEPYADMWLTFGLSVTVEEQSVTAGSGNNEQVTVTDMAMWETTVVSCRANILNMTAEEWCSKRFMTLIDGAKTTAPGFLEYLYFVGSLPSAPVCKAYFDDDTARTVTLSYTSIGDGYGRIDASPANFLSSGRKLLSYEIKAGDRIQNYVVDNNVEPEVAPVLLFWNSFGVQELAYCTGELKQVSSFDRKQARIGRLKGTYVLEERETFKADTGYLTFPMANWWREVLRSKDIKVLTVVNGGVDLDSAKPVIITSEKHEMSNAADHLPRITFEYEYADRNHNVFDLRREGRIFDDTFDYTFN